MSSPRILIVKLSAIGDCIHASPVAQVLRESFPEAHIGWVVHDHCAAVVRGNPNVNVVHTFDRKRMLEQFFPLRKELRAQKYDIAVDLQGLLKSGVVAKISGAKRRYYRSDAREKANWFCNTPVQCNPSQHIIDVYLGFARAIGAQWSGHPPMVAPHDQHDLDMAKMLLAERDDLDAEMIVALAPAAGQTIKQWPTDCFARLIDAVLEKKRVHFAIIGAPGDKLLAQEILAACHHRESVQDLTGRTNLNQLAAVLKQCDLFIGGDTGPMHMAQAVGTQVIALFGPTNPARLGPRGDSHITIYHPCQFAPRAMHEITVDNVLDKFNEARIATKGANSR